MINLETPVNPSKLASLLYDYDSNKRDYLIEGFTAGFRLGANYNYDSVQINNSISTHKHSDLVWESIKKEMSLGRIKGPFTPLPFKNLVISPIGIVPKKTPGSFRMIHNLSAPVGFSVNDAIDKSFSSVQYDSVDDAIRIIKMSGRGSWLAKCDIQSAFRIIPIHPDDHHLLGFSWKKQYFYDTCLPMGCSSSCKIFENFSHGLQWLAIKKLNVSGMVHILDDFFLVEKTHDLCYKSLKSFTAMCENIGVPLAPEKTFGPSNILEFKGIELDTINFVATLPESKINKCLNEINNLKDNKKKSL